MRTSKQILIELIWHFVGWGISFALIYWLATDNLWLCFFISSASSTAQFAITNTKRDIFETLLPMAQSYDSNINTLFEKANTYEEQIDALMDKVYELQNRLDELENNC
jgi:sensor histidine kinase YesM